MGGRQAQGPGHKLRQSHRKVVRTEIKVGDDSGLGDIFVDSKDLSDGGAFISSDLLFELGEELDLEFTPPGTGRTIKVRARVVRVNRDDDGDNVPGMGLQFIDLSEEDRSALADYVAS